MAKGAQSEMMMEILRAGKITVKYGKKPVLRDISFSLAAGEALAVVGESGSGKSTLLRALFGLLPPSAEMNGTVCWQGTELKEPRRLAGLEAGFVFQDSGASFCPVRRIFPQLAEGMREVHGWRDEETRARAEELLAELELDKTALDAYAWELSGGMLQRLGILAALLPKPRLLLADEPTAALDTVTQAKAVKLMKRLCISHSLSAVIVTHHLGVANALADKILVLKDGQMVEYGAKERLLSAPQSDYLRLLLDSVPRFGRA